METINKKDIILRKAKTTERNNRQKGITTNMRIEITNLSMDYGAKVKALTDVNLRLESPSLIGLLGPNGAGKSTLMKLLVAGLLPTAGGIAVDGAPLQKCENELKARLGYLPQSFGLFDELSVWQFLDYMSALKGIKDRKAAIEAAFANANLEAKRKAKIRTLSGGQRQRVGIAQAFLGNPELMILDEPTVGLDPEERIHFRNLFSGAAQDKIVILSTHIIEDVQSVCNQLIVIHQGHILFIGTPSELIKSARGHVGIYVESANGNGKSNNTGSGIIATARVNTADGVACRIVANILPPYAQSVEPTLEDAYMYAINVGGRTL